MRQKGGLLTLSYEANRAIPNYNVMGICKAALEASVKYIARGPEFRKIIRVECVKVLV